MPKIPFVLGGAYDLANLCSITAVRAMRTRGNIAAQIRDLPDGLQISLKIVE